MIIYEIYPYISMLHILIDVSYYINILYINVCEYRKIS